MISDVHFLELYINKQLIELESQSSLNLRINNILFNPTKTSTVQAEYSYSFGIPSTPNNDRIFDYANNLAKVNKFHARYPTQVYADGELLFDGTLTIQKYSSKDKMYTCNLVNIKVDTLEEIFGEMKLTDLKWDVPFDGASTINSVNGDASTKYFFPLVSYGAFQKSYVTKDEVGATYTPKHTLDKYNKWWVESFYPSLNMLETMKKAFENKGYSIGGSAFADPYISNIFASCNLASDQIPTYNIGNPKFGRLSLNVKWDNYYSFNSNNSFVDRDKFFSNSTGGFSQTLSFPYEKIKASPNAPNSSEVEYNFDSAMIWNMMDSKNNSAVTVTMQDQSYMYDPTEMVVVIPADGWYKINLTCNATLSGAGTTFTARQWTNTFFDGDEFTKRDVTGLTRNLQDRTPLEIQLIRNYNDNVELIKGKRNVTYDTGDPNQLTYTIQGQTYTANTYVNKTEWLTEAPHQDPYGAPDPTDTSDMIKSATANRNDLITAYGNGNEFYDYLAATGGDDGGFGHHRARKLSSFGASGSNGNTSGYGASRPIVGGTRYNTYGFMHRDGNIMPYDQAVSTAFICGMSSMSNGTLAVMRDGYSWSKMSTVKNGVFANVEGLDLVNVIENGYETVPTNYCKNEYKNSSNSISCSNNSLNGSIQCCVYLNKNDILQLVAVQRDYEGQKYATSADCNVTITAMNDKSQEELKSDPTWGYNSVTTFPTNLNLFNFTNSETKVSDWISNITKAFNLELSQESNYFTLSTNQGVNKQVNNAVDIDDRASSNEAESEFISYPREMSVQYKINTEEWGFELTVPPEHINDFDWEKYGDSGFTIIQLNDDSYEKTTQNTQVAFSYTYYDNFLWKQVNQDGTEADTSGKTITIPTIAKAEYMAEGYGYEEAMKHDGYSYTQRFWYRQPNSSEYIWLSSHLNEKVWLTYPRNTFEDFNLSYKDTEKSIASEYFNIYPMLSSNYVTVEAYLTPQEYKDLKGGAKVKFDSDLYYVSEMQGYDPTGHNLTKLKLIKKT